MRTRLQCRRPSGDVSYSCDWLAILIYHFDINLLGDNLFLSLYEECILLVSVGVAGRVHFARQCVTSVKIPNRISLDRLLGVLCFVGGLRWFGEGWPCNDFIKMRLFALEDKSPNDYKSLWFIEPQTHYELCRQTALTSLKCQRTSVR